MQHSETKEAKEKKKKGIFKKKEAEEVVSVPTKLVMYCLEGEECKEFGEVFTRGKKGAKRRRLSFST